MKRLFCLTLCLVLALSLTACGPAPSDPTETVKNPFTQGTAAPSGSGSSTQAAATSGAAEPSEQNSSHSGSYGFSNKIEDDVAGYYDYTGGELHVCFDFDSSDDFSVCGIGPLLYLDGIPQPYKTDEEPWYSYLHLFYPEYHPEVDETKEYETDQVLDVYFIPVTGEAGDALELYGTPISNPSMDPRDPGFNNYFLVQHFGANVPVRIVFQATPPELELPEVPDQVLSHTVTYVDEPLLQSWTPEELQNLREYGYSINGKMRPEGSYSWIWYGFDQEPITLDFYIYGASSVNYTLLCYKNYQPVSIDPEDIVYVEVQNGQRTKVQVQIDMSDFDGSTPISFITVLIPRNFLAYEDGTSAVGDHYGCTSATVNFFYFGGEEE